MFARSLIVVSIVALLVAAGCSSNPPATGASTLASTIPSGAEGSAGWWDMMTMPLQGHGVMTAPVYTVTIPRTDLWVQSEMGDVPTEAGICSTFHFYRCECGLMKVVGEFVLPDYEANDVIDALRSGQFTIASVAPTMLFERPMLMSVRFQAEGHTDELIKVIRSALDWTGPMRSATRPSN